MYVSTKTFGHELGLSCAFRQWRADSHCRFLHGYALSVKLVFEAAELDIRNWVVDFGSLKSLRAMLEDTLDHKTLVAYDDPELEWFERANRLGVIEMVKVDATGCEKTAELIYRCVRLWLRDNGYTPRVRIRTVEVCEHGANSAIYQDDPT